MVKKTLPPEVRLQFLLVKASALAPLRPVAGKGAAAIREALDLEPPETLLGQTLAQIRSLQSEIARRAFRSRAALARAAKARSPLRGCVAAGRSE